MTFQFNSKREVDSALFIYVFIVFFFCVNRAYLTLTISFEGFVSDGTSAALFMFIIFRLAVCKQFSLHTHGIAGGVCNKSV